MRGPYEERMRRTAQTTIEGLQAALAAEHAAIYGYGVVGARLRGVQHQVARDLWTAHHARRDKLIGFLIALGTQPVAADAAYELPVQVTSPKAAAQLAARLEDGVLNAYLALAGVDDPKFRRFAAQAMQDATAGGVRWRGSPPATAFPGLAITVLQPHSEQ
jgi:Domain of unknown function (DUF4439)